MVEYPHLQRMAGADLERFVEFAADVPEARLSPERKPAIYIGMHHANWEVIPSIAAALAKPLTIVVSPDDEIDDSHEKALNMTRRVNRCFENWISEKPGEWMCMKRRWPIPAYRRVG